MVHQRVFRWNSLCHNLLRIANRLSELGLVYSDGEVKYLAGAEDMANPENSIHLLNAQGRPGVAEKKHRGTNPTRSFRSDEQ